MKNRVVSLFTRGQAILTEARPPSIMDKHIAATALLFEAAALDGQLGEQEQAAIRTIAINRFTLNEDEAATLLELAKKRQGEANQLFGFTQKIKNSYTPEERVELMEMLWEVVYADGLLHDYEANLMRRIGGLIYVPEIERGNARKRVMARLGIE